MSSKRNNSIKRARFLAAFVFITTLALLPFSQASAADIVNRYIRIGDSNPSEVTTHNYGFTTVTAGNVGSIGFRYCSNSPLFSDPCTAPAGLNVSGASIQNQTGLTGFSISGATTSSRLVITRGAPAFTTSRAVAYNFGNITNPSTPNSINYVRITVYSGTNGTGTVLDQGAVVFVLKDPFAVSAYVPPYLTFCVGVTVTLNCSSAAGFLSDFGEFSSTAPRAATTQFSAATNDTTGYNTYINGQTMTSGSNIIPALPTQTISQPGVSQFGINLRQNSNPSVGANPENGQVASGSVDSRYNVPNQFRFVDGERVAGANGPSGFNRYTVSYMVNVDREQKPGVYASVFTYTAIASF